MRISDNASLPTAARYTRPADARLLLLIALAYAFSLKLALFFPDAKGILAAVWPPGGIALAVLLLAPRRLWRAILAVIFVTGVGVNLLSGRPVFASVGFMVADVLESWGCAWLMRWICGEGRVTFARVREVLTLGVCATAVNSVTALIGAAVANVSNSAPFKDFYLTWWIADGLGILLVTPLLVVCAQSWRRIAAMRWLRLLEAAALCLVWCACTWLGFLGTTADLPVMPRPYWIFMPLVWTALRFGIEGTTLLLSLLAVLAVGFTVAGRGTFPLGGDNPVERLQMVQFFLGAVSLTGLVLAAAVTERRQAEAEQERARRKLQSTLTELQDMQAQMIQQARLSTLGQLASGIAHDFNNILMPILGYSELLLSSPAMLDDREKALDAIKRINCAALDARQITSRLRWIYRPDKETALSPVDTNEIVRDAMAMSRPRWEELCASGIRIHTSTRLEARVPALGDAAQLREALTNLIFNALEAMPQGGELILSSTVEHADVVLGVTDTGVGMTDEVKARCQEAFFSSKNTVKGSGLGLTIVAGIVSRHKGKLEIDSAPGRGTTIRLRVPCAPDGATTANPGQGTDPERAAPAGLRILLADDDGEVLILLEQFLKNDGHAIEKAQNGCEAIAKIRDGTFDLVITDRSMPGANGDEVARATQAHTPDTPVILLSGFGDLMNDAGECPQGVVRVLSKPISQLNLQHAIREVMASKA